MKINKITDIGEGLCPIAGFNPQGAFPPQAIKFQAFYVEPSTMAAQETSRQLLQPDDFPYAQSYPGDGYPRKISPLAL